MDQSLNELRRSLAGAVLAPADPGYDAARRSFNALIDRRPAAIARCLGADDVATAFDFARARGWRLRYAAAATTPPGTASATAGW